MDVKSSVKETNRRYLNNEFSATDMIRRYITKINEDNDNAVVELFDEAIEKAVALDIKRKSGEVGKLAGTFMMIEDSIMLSGKKMTHGSRILENFVSPFTSTALQKLLDEDVIVLGRVNVNEFSYYSKNNVSIYGKVKNAYGSDLTTNSGVGVALKKGFCDFAVGNDVCSNIRKSVALNGVISYRPTYGLCSRMGVSSLASSFDCFSFALNNYGDAKYLTDIVKGVDVQDMNTIGTKLAVNKLNKRVAVVKGINCKVYQMAIESIRTLGYEIKEVDIPLLDTLTSVYQIMLASECGSNLSRIDGIKYGKRSENCVDIEEVYCRTRTEFLGKPIKYLTILGNYMLYTENVCEYYSKALEIKNQIMTKIESVLKDVDVMLLPLFVSSDDRSCGVEDYYKLDDKEVYNVLPEMLGLPVLTKPINDNSVGSVQFVSGKFNDENLFEIIKEF